MFERDAVDLEKLIEAIDRSGLSEFSMVTGDVEIRISKSPAASAAAAQPAQADAARTPSSFSAVDGAAATPAAPAAPGASGSVGSAAAAAAPPSAPVVDPPGLARIRTPMLGAFYRAPEPGAPPFVDVGSRVEPETTVAIIEAMKVFTSVQAGVCGTVREVLAGDRDFVEYDQALFLVELDDAGSAG
ncbi:MAG: acetyl-CoA carboxylase biotin carboxyl carrier protein subunit [Actinotalea sp.]|nr:acetyl-CoA carboxylase biotin carboxyl carrier protein subunit [Actinotalea sp.]